jgi:hypothetical protein
MRATRALRGALLAWGRATEHATGSRGALEHHGATAPSGTAGRADFAAVAAGHHASGALTAAGEALVWGTGRALGLGPGVGAAASARPLAGAPPPLCALALGEHTGAALSAGAAAQARVWGVGVDGQLGLGGALGPKGSYHGGAQEALVATPRALEGEPLAAVALARFRTLLLTTEGVVFAAGAGFHGELGVSGFGGVATAPASVVGLPADDPVAAVAAAHTFSLAATRRGRLFFWGLLGGHGGTRAVVVGGGAGGGGAGAGGAAGAPAATASLRSAAPLELILPGSVGAPLMLAAGHAHALISDGARVWALGASWAGDGDAAVAPRAVALPRGVARVARVAAGPWTAGIVDGDGRAWLAGRLASPLLLGGEAGPSAARALARGDDARAGAVSRARLLEALGQADEIGAAGGADADGLVVAGGALFAPRLTRVVDAALAGARVVDLAIGAAHAVAVVA